MFRKSADIFTTQRTKAKISGRRRNDRVLSIENLENRRLLAVDIQWTNETDPNNRFDVQYPDDALIARQLVNRAIADWEAVINDFNYDGDNDPATVNFRNNVFNLEVFAGQPGDISGRGEARAFTFDSGRPISADIIMDDNADGTGWYFDPTPHDDAEFTAVVNSGMTGIGPAFAASFVDVDPVTGGHSDFYRTILHEIGHAVGINNHPLALLTPLLDPLVHADGTGNVVRDLGTTNGAPLTSFHDDVTPTFGVRATFLGAHIYEGDIYDWTNNDPTTVFEQGSSTPIAFESHPYELMGTGRITPRGQLPQRETMRHLISDLDVKILADAYGYGVTLPSTFDTAHVTLDSLTGTLLVQGLIGWQDDMIITEVGSSGEYIEVQVNNTMERVLKEHVSQIVIAGRGNVSGEQDDIFVGPSLMSMKKEVHWVVSSNQDAVDPGTLGDVHVDLDLDVPGYQVSLRAAVQDANAGAGGWIYVPRGNYKLEIDGSGGVEAGDLEITKSVIIVGSGAGATVIDASGLATTSDRIFDVQGGASFRLDRVTLTGGMAPTNEHGGAVIVRSGANFYLTESAVVDNETTGSGTNGGGIYYDSTAGGSIAKSVITANHAVNSTGGVYLAGTTAGSMVTVADTIIVNNMAVQSPDVGTGGSARMFTSNGDNRLGNAAPGFVDGMYGDYVNPAGTVVHYVVTSLGDTFDDDSDPVVMSLRDAIYLSNIVGSPYAQEIWVPAWNFTLTVERTDQLTDIDASSYGDLDIDQTLTIRGVTGATSVAWRSGADVDAVFDLLGDYDGDGITTFDDDLVSSNDYVIWSNTPDGSTTDLRADGNDDGVVTSADYDIWYTNFNNTLTLDGVLPA
jgi:hypothetical protein